MNRPGRVQYAAASTGGTDYVSFPTAVDKAFCQFDNVTTSTKIAIRIQGSVGGSGLWSDISAVSTLTTGITGVCSTAAAVFDRVRVNRTAKSTSTGTNTVWIIGK